MNEENDSSKKGFKFIYLIIFFLGIVLHMAFAGENYFFNYLKNTSHGSGESTFNGMLKGIYGTFTYAGAGMILSILIITPVIYFISKKGNRNLYRSIAYALCIGSIFRLLSLLI